jgi:hypothetical protein
MLPAWNQSSNREEVLTIMGVLGDIRLELERIYRTLGGGNGEEEEEEDT